MKKNAKAAGNMALKPAGKQIPKGGPIRPQGSAKPNLGLGGKKSIKGGFDSKKALISQQGGKRKGPLEAIALAKAIKGKGGY